MASEHEMEVLRESVTSVRLVSLVESPLDDSSRSGRSGRKWYRWLRRNGSHTHHIFLDSSLFNSEDPEDRDRQVRASGLL